MENENKSSASRLWGTVRAAALAAGLLGIVLLSQRQLHGKPAQECALVVMGGFLVLTAILDLKDGTAVFIYSTIERSKDPVRFWSAIVVAAGLGGTMAILAAGTLLGVWKG